MKKISLSQSQTETKTVVDDELLLEHNQKLSNTNEVDTTNTTIQQKDTLMKSPKLLIILTIIAVLAGVGTGFGTFRITHKDSGKQLATVPVEETTIKAGDEFGSEDEVFDSYAVGYLEKGGIDGEGSHKLLREGGESKTVYLISSVTDLDVFTGMEVEVWGETFKGQKAGWLMDVGRIKVIKVDGQPPTEE